jgi:hypothetical protein
MGTGSHHTHKRLAAGALVAVVAAWTGINPAHADAAAPCGRDDFEAVVEESATALRDLNNANKPLFQDKLRTLKDKRGWSHDQFLVEAAPFVRDDTITVFDRTTDELLSAISQLGQEGAAAKAPDCGLLLELRARMRLLVETQKAKWSYMFDKIDVATQN